MEEFPWSTCWALVGVHEQLQGWRESSLNRVGHGKEGERERGGGRIEPSPLGAAVGEERFPHLGDPTHGGGIGGDTGELLGDQGIGGEHGNQSVGGGKEWNLCP